jgi:peptide/nickel transport system ATP-binding protein
MRSPAAEGVPMLAVDIENLSVRFRQGSDSVQAVSGVTFSASCERLAIVGESGSGKSTIGRAIMGLLPKSAEITATSMKIAGADLRHKSEVELNALRGTAMAMIMQDPRHSLNPTIPVGDQVAEMHRLHLKSDRRVASDATMSMLQAVRIDDPERVYHLLPGQLSGGMCQRIMIAMMLIVKPTLVIADEPTSALDVSVQHEILQILDNLVRELGSTLILISHNLPLVSSFSDRVLIMYRGRIVEDCRTERLSEATHPYSQGLLNCLPRLAARRERLPQIVRDAAWLSDAL